MMTEKSTTQYQTSLRLMALLCKETLSTKKFNMHRQEEGEPVDLLFITSLDRLTEHCNYHNLHDEMIRDRIVVGLQDSNLSERLQTDPELTLDKGITMARQTKAVREQQAVVRGKTNNTCTKIKAVKHSYSNNKNYKLCSKSARFQSSQQERLH